MINAPLTANYCSRYTLVEEYRNLQGGNYEDRHHNKPLLKDRHQEKRQNYLAILSLLNAGDVKKASDYAALTATHDIYQAIKSMEHDKTLSHTDIVAMMRKELRIK